MTPVVIPDLAPTLDYSLKFDRSLCLVRARFTIWTGPRAEQRTVKKGFDKNMSPATMGSDQETLTLHQVKAHNVRAFASSKDFQLEVSRKQLSACQYKSHNTLTQFYFKDMAGADSELFHLSPVVVAQQVHH